MNKPRIVKDYEKLPEDIIEQLKLEYPFGFSDNLISFVNKDGEKKLGLPFETEEYYYLIRMSVNKAISIIEDDDDYDDDGNLKDIIKEEYEEKHGDFDDAEEEDEKNPYEDKDDDDDDDD